jgi:predicted DNA binding CopG/RHH family protein
VAKTKQAKARWWVVKSVSVTIRLPVALVSTIRSEAMKSGRSLTKEIQHRLEESLK